MRRTPGRNRFTIVRGYAGKTGFLGLPPPSYPWRLGSYGYNANGTFAGAGGVVDENQFGIGTGSGLLPISKKYLVGSSEIAAPSQMMALGDATLLPGFDGTNNSANPQETRGMGLLLFAWGWEFGLRPGHVYVGGIGVDRANRLRHARGALNLAFVDGHIEPIPAAELFTSKTNKHRARWNKDNEPHYETYP